MSNRHETATALDLLYARVLVARAVVRSDGQPLPHYLEDPPFEHGACGVLFTGRLPDGRHLDVNALTFGRARVCVGPGDMVSATQHELRDMHYDDGW